MIQSLLRKRHSRHPVRRHAWTIRTSLAQGTSHRCSLYSIVRTTDSSAIISMSLLYDATDVMTGLTEVLCYGTAVVVEPLR